MAVTLPSYEALTNSVSMRKLNRMVDLAAPTDVSVLISGESGVGKELVARTLHERSLRRDRPFVRVNCAALPVDLLESELFGYERGAFTGANHRKPGKFELAHTGTILLDEIGEVPLSLQAKLLQVLQDHEFCRLGSQQDIRVDVRVLAATNRDLAQHVADGGFREDLFYRVNVVNIHVPPLRERREEIPILLDYFLEVYGREAKRPPPRVSRAMRERFIRYGWPGNVRELENVVKRMVVLGTESGVAELTEPVRRSVPLATLPVPISETVLSAETDDLLWSDVLEGSVNLPQLPVLVPPPSNFSQPYKPETFVNLPAFLPAEMTLAEAKKCRDSKVTWYGGTREEAQSIRLFYAAKQETPVVPLTIANYVGTAMARISDGPFIAALCEAAYAAMSKGASVGVVDHGVRPRNTMFGIGFGASGGATGLPAAGVHPYAIAGTLGFGTGWSNQRVEGEVVLQLTGLRDPARSGATGTLAPGAVTPPPEAAAPERTPRAPDPPVVGPPKGPEASPTAKLVPPALR